MKSIIFRSLVVAALAAILPPTILGCSAVSSAYNTTKELYEKGSDNMEPYTPAPRELDAPPEETGLLLVYAEVHGKDLWSTKKFELDAVRIEITERPEQVITVSDFSEDMVVFQGLEPGTYTVYSVLVTEMTGDGGSLSWEIVLPAMPGNTVTIEAGVPRYVGKIEYKDDKRTGERWVESIDPDIEIEIKAWEKLRNKFQHSAWTPYIEHQLRAVREKRDAQETS
jgi:hypothetical protein